MIYLVGEMSNGSAKLRDTYPRGVGRCYVDRPLEPFPQEPWILDNGVFREWNANGRNPETDYAERYARFEARLPRAHELAAEGRGPLFIVAPDRPGCSRSLETTVAWLDVWETELEVPVYLAVQDGMTPDGLRSSGVLSRVAGLFLGGSDEFKASASSWRALTSSLGLAFHWGRCTQSLIAEAVRLGCDSADSSHPNRLAGRRWSRFLEVLDTELPRQVAMWGGGQTVLSSPRVPSTSFRSGSDQVVIHESR